MLTLTLTPVRLDVPYTSTVRTVRHIGEACDVLAAYRDDPDGGVHADIRNAHGEWIGSGVGADGTVYLLRACTLRRAVLGETHGPAVPPPLSPALADLISRLWEIEESDGSWSGGDAVQVLTDWLYRQGASVPHPAERAAWTHGGDHPAADHGRWTRDGLAAFALAHGHDGAAPLYPA